MARDWRSPVVAVAIEDDPNHVLVSEDGTLRDHHNILFAEQDVGRIRAGYVCVHCYEPHERAFPEACSLCGFPMRARQAARFAQEFIGTIRVGPSTSIDEELEIAEEILERRELAARGYRKTDGIIVPRTLH